MNDKLENFQDVLQDFDTAMMTTLGKNGDFHTRPMHLSESEEIDRLYFLTKRGSEKLHELQADHRVSITLQGKNRFMAIAGLANIEPNNEKINSLWSKALEIWFPEGPDDPDIELIHVTLEKAELWDMSGANKIRFLFEVAKAVINDEKIDSDSFGSEKLNRTS